jgi:hypothetical protein
VGSCNAEEAGEHPVSIHRPRDAIAFIHLGQTAVPRYYLHAILHARSAFSGPVYVVAEDTCWLESKDEMRQVTFINPTRLRRTQLHEQFLEINQFDKNFRDGFWTYVVERFFVLEQLMLDESISSVLQLEGDNLLYADYDKLLPLLKLHYRGIAVPFDHDTRAVPGILFSSSRNSITQFCRFIIRELTSSQNATINDMELLGKFRLDSGSVLIDSLPVLPPFYTGGYTNSLGVSAADSTLFHQKAEQLGYIFDANALGQYIGGLDPRNTGGRESIGFINETAMHRFDGYTLRKAINSDTPVVSFESLEFPLANLHVHSKNLSSFRKIGLCTPAKLARPSRISSPFNIPASEYISAERIQRLADVIVTDRRTFEFYNPSGSSARMAHFFLDEWTSSGSKESDLISIHAGRVVFVHTHLLSEFIKRILPRTITPFILISHASDEAPSEEDLLALDDVRIVHFFSQNLDVDHPKATRLPIGIANAMFEHGNFRALKYWAKARPLKKLFYSARFNANTQVNRKAVIKSLSENGLPVMTDRVSHDIYLSEIAASVFTISPPGNGLDCHRTWEAIYLGSIPVVEDRYFKRFFPTLPCYSVTDWSEVTNQTLGKHLETQDAHSHLFDFSPSTLTYWRERIDQLLMSCRGPKHELR